MRLVDKLALSVPEVAELLSISRRATYRLLHNPDRPLGDPATMRLPGGPNDLRVPTANVLAYAARLGVQSEQESA